MIKIINGFKMGFTDEGNGAPLLLIHGYPLNRRMWEPQLTGLSQQCRILAPDLRGHGESEAVPGIYSMDLLAQDLAAFLNELAIDEPVTVCGLSMGGYVSMAFYRLFPERVKALILTATRAAPDSPEGRQGRDAAAKVAQEQGVQAIVEGMLPRLFAPQTVTNQPELVSQVREIMLETSLAGVQGALMGMKERPDSRPLLSTINVPTLIIHGANDQLIPVTEASAMHELIVNSRISIIDVAGHLLNLENPTAFNHSIVEFLG
jgi:3-oxoadipate enol-lactonase